MTTVAKKKYMTIYRHTVSIVYVSHWNNMYQLPPVLITNLIQPHLQNINSYVYLNL